MNKPIPQVLEQAMYAADIVHKVQLHDEMVSLFKEIANSDMAQREEDEGEISPLLERVRSLIAKAEALPTKGSI